MSVLKWLKKKSSPKVKQLLEENLKLLDTQEELDRKREKQLSEFRKGY